MSKKWKDGESSKNFANENTMFYIYIFKYNFANEIFENVLKNYFLRSAFENLAKHDLNILTWKIQECKKNIFNNFILFIILKSNINVSLWS